MTTESQPETPAPPIVRPRVYVETTVVSYLTSWLSRDPHVRRIQDDTHEWWDGHREKYELIVSDTVYEEARRGDAVAAAERIIVLDQLTQILANEPARMLGDALVRSKALPVNAAEDALHIAIAAVYGIEVLLAWNLRHMNNDDMRPYIEQVCKANGYNAPLMRTPKQMMEDRP